MKVQIFKSISIFLLLLAIAMSLSATDLMPNSKKEFTKKIERSFDISASGEVYLSNRYGKVEVKTWDKNKVEIEVVIIVNARSEDAAQQVFDRIKIDFSNGNDYVKAITNIESHKSSWWASSSKSDYEINYLVNMPQSNDLKLANKYGHSFVEDIDGQVEADIKYGDLNMAKIGGNLNLQLGYGNAAIDRSANAKIDLKYSQLRLKRAKDIDIESKYSQIYFSQVGDVRSVSKYDHFELGSVGKFRGDGKYDNYEIESADAIDMVSKYTNVKLGSLNDAAHFELEYGGVRIKNVSSDFSEINLKGKHTEFKIDMDPGASYRIDLSTNFGDLDYPAEVEVVSDKLKSKSNSREVRGYKGSENARGIIKIRTSYGNIKVN